MSNLLCAIAKNEGAYLPEWVHYHLLTGFDKIVIYVNGTDDLSIAILDKIKESYPVDYVICDFVMDDDYTPSGNNIHPNFYRRNKLQSSAYSLAINDFGNIYDNIMFLDIDEFLFSKYGVPDINSILLKYEKYDSIGFRWFCEAGEKSSFEHFLKPEIRYIPANMFKSITRVKKNLNKIIIHSSHSNKIADGKEMLLGHEDPYFIIHRVWRSHDEYLALLYRGDNIDNASNGLKVNRKGWNTSYKRELKTSTNAVAEVLESFKSFTYECDICELINNSREILGANSKKVEAIVRENFLLHEQIKTIIKGTELEKLCLDINSRIK